MDNRCIKSKKISNRIVQIKNRTVYPHTDSRSKRNFLCFTKRSHGVFRIDLVNRRVYGISGHEQMILLRRGAIAAMVYPLFW